MENLNQYIKEALVNHKVKNKSKEESDEYIKVTFFDKFGTVLNERTCLVENLPCWDKNGLTSYFYPMGKDIDPSFVEASLDYWDENENTWTTFAIISRSSKRKMWHPNWITNKLKNKFL